jgi:hypothetical protein
MEDSECETEWLSKYNMATERIDGVLSEPCYDWAKVNSKRTDELILNYYKTNMTQCYYDIYDLLGEWCDIPEDYKKIVSIWIIGTYFHKNFNTYPYLFINATLK